MSFFYSLFLVLTAPTLPAADTNPPPEPLLLPRRLTMVVEPGDSLKARIDCSAHLPQQFQLAAAGQNITTLEVLPNDQFQIISLPQAPAGFHFSVTSRCSKTGKSWAADLNLHAEEGAPCTVCLPRGCNLEIKATPVRAAVVTLDPGMQ